MPRIRLVVKGHVQGVGFRFFASRTAKNLQLKGFVKNLANGGVEVVAEGEKEKIEKFLSSCREGPITANVEGAEIGWGKETGEFKDFGIRY